MSVSTPDYWPILAVAVVSPELVLMAEGNGKDDRVVFDGYGTRMPRRVPSIFAKWHLPVTAATEVVSLATGEVEKVYIRNTVTGVLTVGEVRNLIVPVERVAEFVEDMWQDVAFAFVD